MSSSGSVDEEEDEDEDGDSARGEGDEGDVDAEGEDSVPGFGSNLHRRSASSLLSGCSGTEERGKVKKSYAKIV